MFHIEEEIASQPRCWALAAELAGRLADALPRPGERVAVVGCGSASNIGQVYAALRESAGYGETDAFSASETHFDRPYDRYMFISRSGTTTETLEALDAVPPGIPTTAITARHDSPLANSAKDVVTVEFADELSIVQTRFPTSVMVLLRTHLGEDPAPLLAAAERALVAPLPEHALSARQYTFLGRGAGVGVAHEAALKLRESAQVWVESYPAMEYRHGPIAVAGPGSLVWSLSPPPDRLAAEVLATGATFVESPFDPLVDLIVVHRVAVGLARSLGLDPDSPRHLSYSVVLARHA